MPLTLVPPAPAERLSFNVMALDDRHEIAAWRTVAIVDTEDAAYDFIDGAYPFAEYAVTTDVLAFFDALAA